MEVLFARYRGVLEYYCPNCGHFNVINVRAKPQYLYECKGFGCNKRLAFGVLIRDVSTGPHVVPRDQVFPPPRYIREKWRNYQPMNAFESDLPCLEPAKQRARSQAADPDSVITIDADQPTDELTSTY